MTPWHMKLRAAWCVREEGHAARGREGLDPRGSCCSSGEEGLTGANPKSSKYPNTEYLWFVYQDS